MELEWKKTDDTKVIKVDKNNGAKTKENIVLHLKLVRGVRGVPLAYVVWCNVKLAHILPGYDAHHIKVAHISPRYAAYLNLDGIIATAPIINTKLNFKLSQDCLEIVYFD